MHDKLRHPVNGFWRWHQEFAFVVGFGHDRHTGTMAVFGR
jgi:hypothetical protein